MAPTSPIPANGVHLVDLTDIFANSKFKVFATAAK